MKQIDYTKKLFFNARNQKCDHHFICTKDDEYYDKGNRCDVESAKFLSKNPGTSQVIMLNYDHDFDESWEIIEKLNEVFQNGTKVEDLGFEIEDVIDNIDEL